MKVETFGEDPEVAVVGLIHGDEPAGKKAIEEAKTWEFQKPVKFVLANEKAFRRDERYVEEDLNRAFPGSDSHEGRLAERLLEELRGLKVLDIHSTHSYDRPFATTNSFEGLEREMIRATGVDYAVKFDKGIGALMEHVTGIVVETGHQGSPEAAENAVEIIRRFLAFFDVIDESFEASDPDMFVQEEVVRGDYRFEAENFSLVEEGEVYAENGEEVLRAERDFYPVLMSTNGYEDILGHKARKIE